VLDVFFIESCKHRYQRLALDFTQKHKRFVNYDLADHSQRTPSRTIYKWLYTSFGLHEYAKEKIGNKGYGGDRIFVDGSKDTRFFLGVKDAIVGVTGGVDNFAIEPQRNGNFMGVIFEFKFPALLVHHLNMMDLSVLGERDGIKED
jgi:hypothetical protein